MEWNEASRWESAVLDGGPADGLRTRVADRPHVLQVTRPCPPDGPDDPGDRDDRDGSGDPDGPGGPGADVRVSALYVYRRDPRTDRAPLRYTFDVASP
ncbi:hypothetical protein ABTY35_32580 [Streptomyces fimicarius]|uniref:hypothetical protein n=1 Tax=Streptomyces TaxID=1883 RepID=UPI0004AB81D9|nr:MULTISPECIES: hypothetical protein [Streptomyces]MCX4713758.1 hypothetical protein [Streptomyces griseus]MDX2670711.1 hypothetical protein [Streptomyces sp. NRRL_ISP-5395]QXQ95346.1 hypothetical protein KV381_02725 [Streptomyces sp. WY228]WKN13194.1 hypothetical protein NEH83_02690 [Streptomyces sp. JUS-F4]GHF66803.1 hypothetical protein GCM10010504_39000 [Streptomyces griseus]